MDKGTPSSLAMTVAALHRMHNWLVLLLQRVYGLNAFQKPFMEQYEDEWYLCFLHLLSNPEC